MLAAVRYRGASHAMPGSAGFATDLSYCKWTSVLRLWTGPVHMAINDQMLTDVISV